MDSVQEAGQGARAPLHPVRPSRWRTLSSGYLWRRLGSALVATWGAVTLVFFMVMATGSPLELLVGPTATVEDVARVNELYGFDRPLHEQYLRFLASVVTLDFPKSLRFNLSPFDVLLPAVPYTAALGGTALAVGTLIGVITGYLAVFGRFWLVREVPLLLVSIVQATPVFVVGIVLVLVFALGLHWLPSGGSQTWRHLILPAATLSLLVAAPVARLFRATLVRELEADHVRTALVKQIPLRRVRIVHVALNALVPVTSLVGMQTGSLLGGAVLTEATFGWPGVGTVIVNSVATKDYPVILAAVIFVAVIVSLSNFLADLIAAVLDPRLAVAR